MRSGGSDILGAPAGIEHLGGTDFDVAVLEHVDDLLDGALERLDADDPSTRSALTQLRRDCRDAKETLSTDVHADIPVMLPELRRHAPLDLVHFERLIFPRLGETFRALNRALASAGIGVDDLSRVVLVGGSSHIPLIRQRIVAETGRALAENVDPDHAIATGAAGSPRSAAAVPGDVVAPVAATRVATAPTAPTSAPEPVPSSADTPPATAPAAPVPAAVAPPAPPAAARRSRRGVIAVVALVALLVIGTIAVLAARDDDGPPATAATTSAHRGVNAATTTQGHTTTTTPAAAAEPNQAQLADALLTPAQMPTIRGETWEALEPSGPPHHRGTFLYCRSGAPPVDSAELHLADFDEPFAFVTQEIYSYATTSGADDEYARVSSVLTECRTEFDDVSFDGSTHHFVRTDLGPIVADGCDETSGVLETDTPAGHTSGSAFVTVSLRCGRNLMLLVVKVDPSQTADEQRAASRQCSMSRCRRSAICPVRPTDAPPTGRRAARGAVR